MATRAANSQRSDAEVLSSAIVKIADFWALSNAKLGAVLGLSPATTSRLKRGQSLLDPASMTDEEKAFVLRNFFSLNWDHMLERHPRYVELRDMGETAKAGAS